MEPIDGRWRKNLSFHHTVAIKNHMLWRRPTKRLCHRKWLMLFFLETPKDNRKKALAVDPAKGKTGKSSIFHRTVEMKQPHTITEPYWSFLWNFKKASAISYGVAEAYVSRNRLQKAGGTAPGFFPQPCHRIWLLHLHDMVKIELFSLALSEYMVVLFP